MALSEARLYKEETRHSNAIQKLNDLLKAKGMEHDAWHTDYQTQQVVQAIRDVLDRIHDSTKNRQEITESNLEGGSLIVDEANTRLEAVTEAMEILGRLQT